jgi:hypothetical protein
MALGCFFSKLHHCTQPRSIHWIVSISSAQEVLRSALLVRKGCWMIRLSVAKQDCCKTNGTLVAQKGCWMIREFPLQAHYCSSAVAPRSQCFPAVVGRPNEIVERQAALIKAYKVAEWRGNFSLELIVVQVQPAHMSVKFANCVGISPDSMLWLRFRVPARPYFNWPNSTRIWPDRLLPPICRSMTVDRPPRLRNGATQTVVRQAQPHQVHQCTELLRNFSVRKFLLRDPKALYTVPALEESAHWAGSTKCLARWALSGCRCWQGSVRQRNWRTDLASLCSSSCRSQAGSVRISGYTVNFKTPQILHQQRKSYTIADTY